ncbi:MAG TPA: alanine--tRNA ligase [Terriglobia bacterium]|nr:alanine--tRNA ligase [Terriglobia bacterium]
MRSSEIRTRFLKFFEERGHRVVRSSSLVPANDPTLLFTNAGMNQFKDVFLGREKRDYARACSSQKCVRAGGKHNDLEQVGRTRRHHTFFEMLGNFSFGDYFKAEAIPWAWELVTKDFGISKDKLYATVFREDDEAEDLWAKIVPRERIFRFDEKDNFWQMGETGPCGPCSEIHYDMGPEASDLGHKDCKFPCPDDCGRYVEIWNLVFMQFDRDEQGRMTPLPRPSIDTGAGLERMAAVLQGKLSNFDTDLFRPLIDEAATLANTEYGANHDADVSLRIIADHARASTFLISDGVLPSNEGRGYVLRLIMRRALYHGQTLGMNEPFLYKMSSRVVDMMKDAYPELAETAHHIAKAIKIEEERYAQTTRVGIERLKSCHVHSGGRTMTFDQYVAESKAQSFREFGLFDGRDLFKLHDTYGLRPDFVQDVVKDHFLQVDWNGYNAEMEKQRERARASWRGAAKQLAEPIYQKVAAGMFSLPLAGSGVEIRPPQHSKFLGYEHTRSTGCRVYGIIQNGESKYELHKGEQGDIILDKTPFYAEAGGQVGDTGRFFAPDSDHEVAQVTDTYRPVTGVIAHKAVARDVIRAGDMVTAMVDAERRDAIRRNHTATHLLHAALRTTLGTHVKQAGSLVAPDRLRFDFSHYAELGEQDILDIEDLVNQHVLKNEEVRTDIMDTEAAVNSGAMALFGEKYGDRVRVLSIADGSFSRELCGGTHVSRTGDIGLFKIVSEGSVAAGTRRIEAFTGLGVLKLLRDYEDQLNAVGEAVLPQVSRFWAVEQILGGATVAEKVRKMRDEWRELRKELDAQQMKRASAQAGDLLERAREVKGVRVLSARVEGVSRPAMRQMVDQLRAKLGSGVIALGAVADGKAALIIGVTQDLTAKLDAGKIVRQAAALMEGSGGGRKDLAEAGGKNPEKIEECVQAVPGIVEQML